MKRLIPMFVVLLFVPSPLWAQARQTGPERQVRSVIEQFEQGLRERNLARIEPLMAEDMVALENGHRNDGWRDFRDNHLVPEMKEPAPPSKSEVIRISAAQRMAWGYTRTTLTLTRKSGEKVDAVLWTVYVLEKRNGAWKIVLLDWSLRSLS